jgi:hypothetical protein
MLMKIPLIGIIPTILLMIFNSLYSYLHITIEKAASYFLSKDTLDYSTIVKVVAFLYYLICSTWTTLISYDHLCKIRIQRKNIEIRSNKQTIVDIWMIIIIIPLVLMINYANSSIVHMSLQII